MKERLIKIVRAFQEKRIMVLGDMIVDEYWFGDIKRVSREAPVLILEHDYSESILGGAANVVNNIVALGGNVLPVSIIGDDESGKKILELFDKKGIKKDFIVVDKDKRSNTPTKIRVMAGSLHTTRQQTLRIDRLGKNNYSKDVEDKLIELIKENVEDSDVLLVSDYGTGVLSDRIINLVNEISYKIPVVVDSRYKLHKFRNILMPTPNEEEASYVLKGNSDDFDISEMARKLAEKLNSKAALITRGKNGMVLFDGKDVFNIPVVGSAEAVDVTGAGDTVSSVISLALASGAGFYEAANLANAAASIAVMKRGNAVVSAEELEKVLEKVF